MSEKTSDRKRERERERAYAKQRRANDPAFAEAKRAAARKYSRKGVTYAGDVSQVKAGDCDICGTYEPRLHFDHCHATSEFRGWLCGRCNQGLGMFLDNQARLHRAAEYLERAMPIKQFLDQGAIFSDDRKHRFRLYFEWDLDLPRLVMIMLNPSKADADPNSGHCFDPTLRAVLELAERMGHGAVDVVNVYSVICTDSRQLPQHRLDLVRKGTVTYFDQAIRGAGKTIVCGWGRQWRDWREPSVLRCLLAASQLWCFGKNQDGSPKHPLYLARSTQLEPWSW